MRSRPRMENHQGWNSLKNGFCCIRNNLGFGNLIDLGFSNEVVGGGKTEDS